VVKVGGGVVNVLRVDVNTGLGPPPK